MSYATRQTPTQAIPSYRSSFSSAHLQRGWAPTSDSLAAAGLVLSTALELRRTHGATIRSGAPPENGDARFDTAVGLYQDCHWEQAFASLALLADQGHAPAAKLALLMLRYGATLYGTSFSAQPAQVARWAQRVLRANSRATDSPRSMTAIA